MSFFKYFIHLTENQTQSQNRTEMFYFSSAIIGKHTQKMETTAKPYSKRQADISAVNKNALSNRKIPNLKIYLYCVQTKKGKKQKDKFNGIKSYFIFTDIMHVRVQIAHAIE